MTQKILKTFFRHLRPYTWLLCALYACIILSEVGGVIVPIYYKKFFDQLTGGLSSTNVVPVLIGFLTVIVLIHSASWLLRRSAGFLNNYLQPQVMRSLEITGFDNLHGHSASFFANNFTGSLVRKVRRLSRAYEELSDTVQWNFVPLIVALGGSIIVLWWRSPLIAGATFVWVAVFAFVNIAVSRWRLKYDELKASKDSEVTAVLADAITNHVNIKLFTSSEYEKGVFNAVTSAYRKLVTFSWNIAEINDATQYGLMIIIEFVVMYLAIRLWIEGTFTIGDFALLQSYLVSIFAHVQNVGRVVRRTYEAFADAREMVEILETPHEVTDTATAKPLAVRQGAIAFSGVDFSYRKTRHVFKNFNLAVEAREKIALVGPSGSGKTTIVQLLLRFFDVQRGTISIDGQCIEKVTQDSLRARIALVPQDPILFHRTVRENIRYGRLSATDAEMRAAAKKARCDVFIEHLPEEYDTYVGERGIKLSGGERQRIAIARAILKNAPILVLDEATSSLDSESEALIQEALETLMKNKTSIVIAHRLSTILKMDRIIVLQNGMIIDHGTHRELMKKKGGLYHALWKIQSSGFAA